MSGHNSYWLWGPGPHTGDVVLVVGGDREKLLRLFQSVEEKARTECDICMPYENDQPVWVARRSRAPLAELWPRLKHYD